jgi:hypothetical protein
MDDCAEALLRAWRDAQREVRSVYADWCELGSATRRAAYLAALDREQRAAEVYAEVVRRLTHFSNYGRGPELGGHGPGAPGNPSASARHQALSRRSDQKS